MTAADPGRPGREPETTEGRASDAGSGSASGGGGPLTSRSAFRLFLPLSFTDVIMTMSGPILAMGLARLAAPQTSLAAYSVAESTSSLTESPVLMLIYASTALTRYRGLWRPLGRFTLKLAALLTVLHFLIALTPAYHWVFRVLLSQPEAVVQAARPAFLMLGTWPLVIGWRRYCQGVLISRGESRRIAVAGTMRLVTLAVLTYVGVCLKLPGATLAGLVVALACVVEAVAITLYTRPYFTGPRAEIGEEPPTWAPRTVRETAAWYWPLAMTQALVWAVRPFVNGAIALTVAPRLGLAAWPVAWATVFLVSNSVRAMHQVTLSLVTGPQQYRLVRRMAWLVGLTASGVMGLLAFTPLGMDYMRWLLGLGEGLEEVARAALPALRVAVFYPLLVAIQNWLQGLLIRAGQPRWVNGAAIAGGVATLVIVYAGALIWRLPGAPLGMLALTAGLLAEIGVLGLAAREQMRYWTATAAAAPALGAPSPGAPSQRGMPSG